MARPAGFPPCPPVAPSLLDTWRARRHLNRLALRLRRDGWTARPRYGQSPPLLRVFDPRVPCIGDSITAVRDETGWWFVSSTGDRLAPCPDLDGACAGVARLLVPWVVCALGDRNP
ncbi:hypothetical protein [Actinomadura formosensis]|uniref:hypothetical protein n=1 Tax=Actinomadura formosensis TaxID=60706 RepID=UPI000834E8EA|nr:hypothetical protein [Actinomadura formosensis]